MTHFAEFLATPEVRSLALLVLLVPLVRLCNLIKNTFSLRTRVDVFQIMVGVVYEEMSLT